MTPTDPYAHRMRRALAPLVTVALLAGCSSSPAPQPAATSAATTATPTPSVTPAPTLTDTPEPTPSRLPQTTAATPTPTPAPTPARTATRPALVLEPDGLGVLTGTSSIRRFPFGSPASAVRTAVAAVLGPLRTSDLPECGQGPRVGSDRRGFSLLFDGTRFVGWTDQGAPGRRLGTADGLRVGSTRAQLQRALGALTVTDGSLGIEWNSTGGLFGLLDGERPTARVTVISAGETCFFR